MAPQLSGKRVLITGASSGIGVAAAAAFAGAGADVALLARRREGLELAAQGARAFGGGVHVVPADVADRPPSRRRCRRPSTASAGSTSWSPTTRR
jgi:NAD(P)-dependent dehydrogenase (short-subunit alcohol dehydrogenase family)